MVENSLPRHRETPGTQPGKQSTRQSSNSLIQKSKNPSCGLPGVSASRPPTPTIKATPPPVQQHIKSEIQKSLLLLARGVGIQTSYTDTAGKLQHAAPETLAAILELWGITANSRRQIHDALVECELNRWQK